MLKNKSKVLCDVSNCMYNNTEEGDCRLKELSISSIGRGSECCDTSSTICQSFESSGGVIPDNEYEVSSELSPEEEEIELEKETKFID